MDHKKLLIVSSAKDEAITHWISTCKNHFPVAVDVLLLEDLLQNYEIHDELTQKKTIIRWLKSGKLRFSNTTHQLLNRIIYVEDNLFDSYKKEDREYAKREFEAYLGFALNSFSKVQDIAINGICEHVYSLPQQWNLIKKHLGISVPFYYWGYRQSNPIKNLKNSREDIIYSNIYDFLNWSNLIDNYSLKTIFCFIKPKGNPLFLLSLGEKYLLSSHIEISDSERRKIDKILSKIKIIFNYFVFELLLFSYQEEITFGCINIDIVRSSKNPDFNHFIDSHLIKEYYQCLNWKAS